MTNEPNFPCRHLNLCVASTVVQDSGKFQRKESLSVVLQCFLFRERNFQSDRQKIHNYPMITLHHKYVRIKRKPGELATRSQCTFVLDSCIHAFFQQIHFIITTATHYSHYCQSLLKCKLWSGCAYPIRLYSGTNCTFPYHLGLSETISFCDATADHAKVCHEI